MPEKRRKYDPDFREGAVRVVRETGKSIAPGGRGPRYQQGHAGQLGDRRTRSPGARS